MWLSWLGIVRKTKNYQFDCQFDSSLGWGFSMSMHGNWWCFSPILIFLLLSFCFPSPPSKYKYINRFAYITDVSVDFLGWLKSLFSFFHKIKDSFLIFTSNLLVWIFWVCRLSPTWCYIDCSPLMSQFDRHQLQLVYQTVGYHPARISSTKLHKALLTCSISAAPSSYTAWVFLCLSVVILPFLNNKA